MKGTVKEYSVKKCYGRITGADGREYFVHKSSLPFWTIFLVEGMVVEFTPKNTKRGIRAVNIIVKEEMK